MLARRFSFLSSSEMATAIVLLEIVSLLWSHPILTGLVILMFTTPLFHLVLFFTPLLVSTALCVIALISIGPQIEKIREERQNKLSRGVAGIAVEQRPVNRYLVLRQGRPQRPLGHGGRRWADWVKGIEIHGNTVWLSETHIMRDIADEGLKADFTHEEGGGITMTPEDFGGASIKVDGDGTSGAFTTELTTANQQQQQQGLDEDRQQHQQQGLDEDRQQQQQQQEQQQQDLIPNESQLQLLEQKHDPDVEALHAAAAYTRSSSIDEDVLRLKAWSGLKIKVPGAWPDQDRFSELVPVMEDESAGSRAELFIKGQPTFALNPSTTARKKKKAPWYRRRRIPCLSKALGQLRERICSQIRRIFS